MSGSTHIPLTPNQPFALGGPPGSSVSRTLLISRTGLFRVHAEGVAIVDDDALTKGPPRAGLRGDTGATGKSGSGSVDRGTGRPGGGGTGTGGGGTGTGGGQQHVPRRGPVTLDWSLTAPNGVVHRPRSQADPSVFITSALLAANRDAAGFSSRPWTLTLAAPLRLSQLTEATCAAQIDTVIEPNISAAPLVDVAAQRVDAGATVTYGFDVVSVGEFTVDLQSGSILTSTLLDPTGAQFATGGSTLRAAISPRDLHRLGRRGWQLSLTNVTREPIDDVKVLARMIGHLRIPAHVLQERFNAIAQGAINGGSFSLRIDHESQTSTTTRPPQHLPVHNTASITIDEDIYYTLDAFGFLDDLEGAGLTAARQVDPQAATTPIEPNVPYLVSRFSIADAVYTNMVIGPVSVAFTPPATPTLNDSLARLAVHFVPRPGGQPTEISEGTFQALEINSGDLRADLHISASEGTGWAATWVVDASSVNGNVEDAPDWVKDYRAAIESKVRDNLTALLNPQRLQQLFTTLMGGEVTFVGCRWNGDSFVFDFVAPEEPAERTVSPVYSARGEVPPGGQPSFQSPNLQKIEHIVVLLMENRSFDHVLGHLSLTGGRSDIDGLTQAYVDSYAEGGRPAPLSATTLPFDPDHSFDAVKVQMGSGLGNQGPMRGFALQFLSKYPFLAFPSGSPQRVAQDDPFYIAARNAFDEFAVLGYHTAQTLPVYAELAAQYMVCDRWFASHPGPTFPNRFFYLGGALGPDADGEPQRDNGADSLRLLRSRTIQDALTERGVPWTMFESGPDVCMLRMYARYAFDDTVIRPINEFYAAARAGTLPAVSFLEPQYHLGRNTNDDHPPTDMAAGQRFVAGVYSALTTNPKAWEKTLFVITYDEHGGLADHVVPPLADRYQAANQPVIDISYGVRVPAFIVSPWVPAGATTRTVGEQVFDHTSILKTIVNRFMADDPPILSDRMAFANDLFPLLTLDRPRPVPPPPAMLAVATPPSPPAPRSTLISDSAAMHAPLRRGGDLFGPDVDWHEFMARLALLVS